MNILCPTDFSNTSANAIQWICQLLNESKETHNLILLHCIQPKRQVRYANPHEDVEIDIAKRNAKNLLNEVEKINKNLSISSVVIRDEPSSYIVEYAKHNKIDWIVMGSKGLTDFKELTIGSVANYCIQNSEKPVLVIPPNVNYKPVKKVMLGVDDECLVNAKSLAPLISVNELASIDLDLVHVQLKGDDMLEYDPLFDLYLRSIPFEYCSIPLEQTVANTLKNQAEEKDIDILFVIHKKRHWISKLFHFSVSKSELFNIKVPLFVLQDGI